MDFVLCITSDSVHEPNERLSIGWTSDTNLNKLNNR